LSVFADAADAMLILDGRRKIVDANPAASTLFGLSTDALISRLLDEFVIDGLETTESDWRELMAFGEAKREHRVASEGRDPRVVECSFRASVRTNRHLCIARDITERRHAREQIERYTTTLESRVAARTAATSPRTMVVTYPPPIFS